MSVEKRRYSDVIHFDLFRLIVFLFLLLQSFGVTPANVLKQKRKWS